MDDESPNVTEEQAEATQTAPQEQTEKKSVNPAVWVARIVFLLAALIFVWYIYADRYTPYTDQAVVVEITIPVTPRVSGNIIEINVRLHSEVQQGDLLFVIDTSQYALAVRKAEANLKNVIQEIGVQGADIQAAASNLGVAKAQLDRAQRSYNRAMSVKAENPGALSQADIDRVETSLNQAKEKVASAEANLAKAKKRYGPALEENPKFLLAINDLHTAQLNLSWTKIYAPSSGYIESFNLDVGYYCQAGKPIATLLTKEDLWIQANFKENNLPKMKVGDTVLFILDLYPGKVFGGKLRSISYGVQSANKADPGSLPLPDQNASWLKDPKRFPVIIGFDDPLAKEVCRSGGQADVVVFTGDHSFLNTIARFRIWINSKLSYVR